MVNNLIKVALLIVIVVLAYFVVESILGPVRFNKEVATRNVEVIQNLRDIRTAEMAYKAMNGKYTADFDTLVDFLKFGEIPMVKMTPDPDDTTNTLTIRDTIGYIPVIDSLFGNRQGYNVNNLRYIPFTNNISFELDANQIEKGGVDVNVFEATASYKEYLKGLDDQMVLNLIASKEQIEKYPGLKVGSMVEASTDGNWE
ncbi:MAG: hypothetical protein DRJ05_01030 [Bacteroidetes bacterium]|nr:MAG: hypothetical protein DRJ05_01030 [Bacteroidota bacterium]